ncbi:hypothetical protein EVAR_63651_1 [Eumeta japonica]|uniref:Uncharacterized protein n=1 Tax=Eumeta variegata TaxID=151549 RepID=A0A4C1ZD51_EUMVA|nr:hypothetical protein EVAR_63651_1 [Eumeta japonica]
MFNWRFYWTNISDRFKDKLKEAENAYNTNGGLDIRADTRGRRRRPHSNGGITADRCRVRRPPRARDAAAGSVASTERLQNTVCVSTTPALEGEEMSCAARSFVRVRLPRPAPLARAPGVDTLDDVSGKSDQLLYRERWQPMTFTTRGHKFFADKLTVSRSTRAENTGVDCGQRVVRRGRSQTHRLLFGSGPALSPARSLE